MARQTKCQHDSPPSSRPQPIPRPCPIFPSRTQPAMTVIINIYNKREAEGPAADATEAEPKAKAKAKAKTKAKARPRAQHPLLVAQAVPAVLDAAWPVDGAAPDVAAAIGGGGHAAPAAGAAD